MGMSYRNGTYIAFHANGTTAPTESDTKYYRLLQAWHVRDDKDFEFVNSHDKASAVRDTSKKETLKRSLRQRLDNSKNMILIIGKTTKEDADWIPFEIEYAVDTCKIPVIATYTAYSYIMNPAVLAAWWPPALKSRIASKSSRVLHIPFKQLPLTDAVSQFDHNNPPKGPHSHYTETVYKGWKLLPAVTPGATRPLNG